MRRRVLVLRSNPDRSTSSQLFVRLFLYNHELPIGRSELIDSAWPLGWIKEGKLAPMESLDGMAIRTRDGDR
ncbi:MAG TPA: hypothetical protein VE961_08340 [Pyrinomonadaceae bacterium]|nr:hypothetical protein [Pyrinomonadaceae bacterium]